jgi:IS605 OrfB family transposase
MVRTVKLSYATVPQAIEVIAQWRKAQSVVIRTAYNRVREGKKDKEILDRLRTMPQGSLDAWLTLSALRRARALHRANPERVAIFGGKHNLQLRSQGKITAARWKAKRLLPLYFEGHAKSYGEQGGNHRFVLDIEHNTVWFYPKAKVGLPLQIKLGKKSNYRELLEALQFRCTWHRDVPFTVSLTETDICISWDEKVEPLKRKTNLDRVLALDLNPNRIGAAVLERDDDACKPLKWAVYDYPELNRKLGKPSDHPDSVYQLDKRVYELSGMAKEITALAAHFQCRAVITEHLNIETQDHGKGRSFNRAVNNQWTRKGFVLPLVRRLEQAGIRHVEVNPAYSSKMGNLLWGWPMLIPDPACAAVELGRRFLQGDPKSSERKNGGNRWKEERQAQASQGAEARAEWKRVWNQLHPQSGDTPRCTLPALRRKFPAACPSPSPFKVPQSLVSRSEPARIAAGLRIHMRKDF